MGKHGDVGTTGAGRRVLAGTTARSGQALYLTGLRRSRALRPDRDGHTAPTLRALPGGLRVAETGSGPRPDKPTEGYRHGTANLAAVRTDNLPLSWRGIEALRALRVHTGRIGRPGPGP